MDFYILTLFPQMIIQALSYSIIKRAQQNNLININCIDIRDFSKSKHKHVDDTPYGGGCGMVMQAQPIYDAWKSINKPNSKVIYVTPQGKLFNQNIAQSLSKEKELIILCGHYEGVDERIIEQIVTDEISIGDFILTGGELPAMVLIDCICRLIPNVLPKKEAYEEETFKDGLLEFPQYTKPQMFMDKKVPDILLSGHHSNIAKWRYEQSLIRTYIKRKDLIDNLNLTKEDIQIINSYKQN